MSARSEAQQVTRRDLMKAAAGIAGMAILGSKFASLASGATAADPRRLVFLGSAYLTMYDGLAEKFQQDWGVPVDMLIEPNIEPQVAKLTSMFVARDQLDCALGTVQNLGLYVKNDMIDQIDDLPGAKEYINDFTGITKGCLQVRGRTVGLPASSNIWMNMYYEDKLREARFKPFRTWDELLEQAQKAKKDGIAKYPLLWVGGIGTEQLPFTWFTMAWNRGSAIFDKDLKPLLGPGSIARETLAWWRKTFLEWQVSDPKSLEVRFIPAARAFNTGDYLYMLGNQLNYIVYNNDPALSPIAGKVRPMLMPGDGRTLGQTQFYFITRNTRRREWAWRLLQYLGGKTKDGEFIQARKWVEVASVAPAFKSLMNRTFLAGWKKFFDLELPLRQWPKGTAIVEAVPAILETWYPKWIDGVNAQLQDCLRGKITADQACDILIKAADDLKKSR